MATDLSTYLAEHIRSRAVPITKRWVERLVQRLDVEAKHALPTESILNHIPAVLITVANYTADPGQDPLSSMVREDLRKLADLRQRQGFSAVEVLAEFAILADLVEEEIVDAMGGYQKPVDTQELVRLVAGLTGAIGLLGAETVARFRTWRVRRRDERMRLLEGYTAMLSHELANRLGAAETAVRVILESPAPVSGERLERLHQLTLRSIKSGLETVQSVRSLFRLASTAGSTESVRSLPLSYLIRDAVHQLRMAAAEHGVQLKLVTKAPPLSVDADRLPLVLYNLISNAIDHHDRPDGRGQVDIEVTEGPSPDTVTITITDDGPGIPADLRERVFEPRVRDPNGNGAGLGLAIAKEAVEQMGGSIAFALVPDGRGTTFEFTIPGVPTGVDSPADG